MTNEELIKALRWCSIDEYVPCIGCPMDAETHGTGCFNIMHQRAAAAIEALQATIELMKPYMPDFFPDANKVTLPKMEVQE